MSTSSSPKSKCIPVVKRSLTSEEETALMMTHASLTMAASHIKHCPGAAVRMLSQVAMLLAEGDDDTALERLTQYVASRKEV
jgi:hypothetical protein